LRFDRHREGAKRRSDPDLGRKRAVWIALLRNKRNFLRRKAIRTPYLWLSLDRFVASHSAIAPQLRDLAMTDVPLNPPFVRPAPEAPG